MQLLAYVIPSFLAALGGVSNSEIKYRHINPCPPSVGAVTCLRYLKLSCSSRRRFQLLNQYIYVYKSWFPKLGCSNLRYPKLSCSYRRRFQLINQHIYIHINPCPRGVGSVYATPPLGGVSNSEFKYI